jgi:putative oxidoreductase
MSKFSRRETNEWIINCYNHVHNNLTGGLMHNEKCDLWRKRGKSAGLLVIRLGAGGFMAFHGAQKIFTPEFMPMMIDGVAKLGFPMPTMFAWLAALSEFVGGLLIVVGLVTRIAAGFIAIVMAVAFFGAHAGQPFMNRELPALFGIIMIGLKLTGAGCYSLDSKIRCLCCKKDEPTPLA